MATLLVLPLVGMNKASQLVLGCAPSFPPIAHRPFGVRIPLHSPHKRLAIPTAVEMPRLREGPCAGRRGRWPRHPQRCVLGWFFAAEVEIEETALPLSAVLSRGGYCHLAPPFATPHIAYPLLYHYTCTLFCSFGAGRAHAWWFILPE